MKTFVYLMLLHFSLNFSTALASNSSLQNLTCKQYRTNNQISAHQFRTFEKILDSQFNFQGKLQNPKLTKDCWNSERTVRILNINFEARTKYQNKKCRGVFTQVTVFSQVRNWTLDKLSCKNVTPNSSTTDSHSNSESHNNSSPDDVYNEYGNNPSSGNGPDDVNDNPDTSSGGGSDPDGSGSGVDF